GALSQAYEYDAWGNPTIYDPDHASKNRYLYTGREWDAEIGLYYYRARHYSAVLGRFIQPDPAGYVDGPNLHAYVQNAPTRWRDSQGLQLEDPRIRYWAEWTFSGLVLSWKRTVTFWQENPSYMSQFDYNQMMRQRDPEGVQRAFGGQDYFNTQFSKRYLGRVTKTGSGNVPFDDVRYRFKIKEDTRDATLEVVDDRHEVSYAGNPTLVHGLKAFEVSVYINFWGGSGGPTFRWEEDTKIEARAASLDLRGCEYYDGLWRWKYTADISITLRVTTKKGFGYFEGSGREKQVNLDNLVIYSKCGYTDNQREAAPNKDCGLIDEGPTCPVGAAAESAAKLIQE
ncbi:MAG: RHS repeat-associated core domain-containing protein, partial [Verrucomicrobia bacterium]|nr:RHS repeat-associated core domain-containing protein [Verrucomicrobiota bacterium]